MTTEKYLYRLCWLRQNIMSHSMKAAEKEGLAENMVLATDKERVQTSPSDKMSNIMSDWADEDAEVQRLLRSFRKMVAQVNALSGEYSSALVYRRYCYKQNMRDIARELNVSRSTLYRIHRSALAEFEEKHGKFYRKKDTF